jgi:hypothetical protein
MSKQPDSDSFHDLPLLSQTIGETTLNNLPTLTEVVTGSDSHSARVLNDAEIQQMLRQLETHLETLFTKKLSLRLEELQRVAIDLALDELKAELPELLRETLDNLNTR